MKYKAKNGFHKFYNEEGKKFRVRFKDIENISINSSVLIKFKSPDDEQWKYHSTKRKFNSVFDVIRFLGMNVLSEYVIFEVVA